MKDLLCGLVSGNAYNVVNTSSSNSNNEGNNSNNSNNAIRRRSTTVINRVFRRGVPNISNDTRRPSRSFVLLLVGLVAIAAGCFILVLNPYEIVFNYKLLFAEGGEVYELWRKPPVNIYLKVMLFNVTNADEFLAGLEPLRVQEVGPYVYKEDLEHSNVTFNTNGTLSMIPKHPLTWVPHMSNGTEEDLLMLPNIALLSIAQLMRDKPFFTRMGMNMLIRQTDSKPLVRMTAREFMFGYKTTLVTLGHKFLTSWIYFEKLGLIDRMYEFTGDFSTVFTGETDRRTSGVIDTYNGSPYLPQWEGEYCAMVQGASDATKFFSYIKPGEQLTFFRKSVCRAMNMVYNGTSTVEGLTANHYVFEDNSLDNGKYNEKNKCFCRHGKCLPAGLIDVTECYYGFPIAVSYPHFLEGDQELIEAVQGSNPDPAKHMTHFKIEPDSGLPLDVSVKFQINMALDDISAIYGVEKFSDMVLPMLWVDIAMDRLPTELRNHFIVLLNVLPMVQTVSIYFLFSTGCCVLVFSIARTLFTHVNKQRQQQQQQPQQSRANSSEAEQRRGSGYTELECPNSKEMEMYYCSLLQDARESDIV